MARPSWRMSLTAQIQDLKAEIRALKLELGVLVPPQTASEKRISNLSQALARLQKKAAKDLEDGFVDIRLDATIDRLNSKLITVVRTVGLGLEDETFSTFSRVAGTIERALATFTGDPLGEFADEALRNAKAKIKRLDSLAPAAGAAGLKISKSLAQSLQSAIITAAAEGRLPAAKALKRLAEQLAAGFCPA